MLITSGEKKPGNEAATVLVNVHHLEEFFHSRYSVVTTDDHDYRIKKWHYTPALIAPVSMI